MRHSLSRSRRLPASSTRSSNEAVTVADRWEPRPLRARTGLQVTRCSGTNPDNPQVDGARALPAADGCRASAEDVSHSSTVLPSMHSLPSYRT
jgi:hypothetical protein